MNTQGKFTALVGTGKYRDIHGFGETPEEAVEECMAQIRPTTGDADEVIVGFWTPTGTLPARNMWLRHIKP